MNIHFDSSRLLELSMHESDLQSLTMFLLDLIQSRSSLYLQMSLVKEGYLLKRIRLLSLRAMAVSLSHIRLGFRLTQLVHRLSEADHIIILGKNGQILEQGTYDNLSISGDYVQSLARTPEKKQGADQSDDKGRTPNQFTGTSNQPVQVDSSRQTGDWKVYVYYTRSLGLLGLLTLSTFVALNAVFLNMQCGSTAICFFVMLTILQMCGSHGGQEAVNIIQIPG